jgi:hypothetical protein
MSILKFLCDEDTVKALITTLRQMEPSMDILRVGESGAPAAGTLDPDLLIAAETQQRCLISGDRSTMPIHMANHFAAGRHTNGVLLLRHGFPLARYVQDIVLIWHAMTAEEWVDATEYIPY